MQEVIAAITTSPWPRSWVRPSTGTRPLAARLVEVLVHRGGERRMQIEDHPCPAAVAALVELLVHRGDEARLDLLERDAILRALRAGERRLDAAELELEHVGEDRIERGLDAIHALRLGVGRDQIDPRLGAGGVGQIGDRVVVDREEAAGRAVFRRHVADGGAVRDGQAGEAGAEELDELADHAALAQHLRDGEHEVGRRHAFLELAGELDADHLGQNHRIGLAEHRGFRLDAADAPAEHGEAVHHRGVRVGADQRCRDRRSPSSALCRRP